MVLPKSSALFNCTLPRQRSVFNVNSSTKSRSSLWLSCSLARKKKKSSRHQRPNKLVPVRTDQEMIPQTEKRSSILFAVNFCCFFEILVGVVMAIIARVLLIFRLKIGVATAKLALVYIKFFVFHICSTPHLFVVFFNVSQHFVFYFF